MIYSGGSHWILKLYNYRVQFLGYLSRDDVTMYENTYNDTLRDSRDFVISIGLAVGGIAATGVTNSVIQYSAIGFTTLDVVYEMLTIDPSWKSVYFVDSKGNKSKIYWVEYYDYGNGNVDYYSVEIERPWGLVDDGR